MILVTGGLGFIGSHTARAVLDLGEDVLIARRRRAEPPDFLTGETGGRVVLEDLDVGDPAALGRAGGRHSITAIVHLATADGRGLDTIETLRANTHGLLTVLRAAQEWSVRRVVVASTLGVYVGVDSIPFREDAALPVEPVLPIPVFKKSAELFASLVAESDGLDAVAARISTIWGPGHRNLAPVIPRLVHAAVRGHAPDHGPPPEPAYADDGRDLCYVKDCARGIALLATAEHLRHRIYNVAHGRATTHAEVAAAIRAELPGSVIDLPPGRDPDGPRRDTWLDISRLSQDTGYRPEYGLHRGVREYVDWLQAGNEF